MKTLTIAAFTAATLLGSTAAIAQQTDVRFSRGIQSGDFAMSACERANQYEPSRGEIGSVDLRFNDIMACSAEIAERIRNGEQPRSAYRQTHR